MRLKKAEREEYLQTIRASQNEKIIQFKEALAVDYAWFRLACDHYQRMRLDLDHVGRLPLSDMIGKDVIGGMPATRDYLQHYGNEEFRLLKAHLANAENGLQYLRKLDGNRSMSYLYGCTSR